MITGSKSIQCLLLAAVIAAGMLSTPAQSGRRQTKVAPAAPVPTPTPEPTPAPKREAKASELNFFVGIDRLNFDLSYPISFYDAVLRGCADRLTNTSSASVDVSDNLTRGDAVKKARAAKGTYYVILLQLSAQTMNSTNQGYDQIELEYIVFAAGTAKVVTSGRSYQNSNRAGPVVVGPTTRGSTSGIYREQLLRRAAEEAADRILKALHLAIPTTVPHLSSEPTSAG
jgi:hypothetical protein